MNVIHTILPGAAINEGYLDDDNITFIQHKIAEVLSQEFNPTIIVGRSDIIRVMQRVLEERREIVPKMNQRVIMYITNDFRRNQLEINRNMNWENGFVFSQQHIDPIGRTMKFDMNGIKTTDKKKYDGRTKVGGTTRFYFT